MKANTLYRLATSPRDYARCHAMLREQTGSDTPLQFPTVMAFEGEELVGFLGTHPSEHAIVAGPLVMMPGKRSIFRWRRYVEAYENVLMAAGVHIYLTSVSEKDEDYLKVLDQIVAAGGGRIYARTNGEVVYLRDLRGTGAEPKVEAAA